MAKGYATVQEVADVLGMDASDMAVAAEIETALEYVEHDVDQYCQTTFVWEQGATKRFQGSGTDVLVLGYYIKRLLSISIVNTDGTVREVPTDVSVMPTNSRLGVGRWLERRSWGVRQIFPLHCDVLITADWGFETTPPAVKRAIAYGVKHYFDLRDHNELRKEEIAFGRSVESVHPDDVQYLPRAAKTLLGPYRNGRWATV